LLERYLYFCCCFLYLNTNQ